jgi:two-component system phosphate regulon sensor histidine kinase PhoR
MRREQPREFELIRSRYWLLIVAVFAAAGGAVALRFSVLVGFLLILIAGFLISLLLPMLKASKQNPASASAATAASTSPLIANVFEIAFDEMHEALLVVDSQFRVVAWNRAAQNLFPNLRDSDPPRLTEITRETAIYNAFMDGIEGRERNHVKVEFYREGPKSFDLRVLPLPSSKSEGPAGAVGILFDVTMLDRLENVRQEFLSNVSHELRTPLTSIMALAETLVAGAVDDANNNRRFLAMIQKNSQRMQHLLNDILELSTIESGNVNVQPEPVLLASAVDDVINSLSTAAAARNVLVKNSVADKVTVFADPRRLIQMLTNLIHNAIKFNRENGTVTITHERSGERDRIQVADTGEGIPTQHLDRVFERFYRVDRARSRDLGGTGLGLAIVKHLVRAHAGEIFVSSRVGEGTEFVIELPRAEG